MYTLKLYAHPDALKKPVTLGPDPDALGRGEYLCVGTVALRGEVEVTLSGGVPQVRVDRPGHGDHRRVLSEADLLEDGFYPDPDLDEAVIAQLTFERDGQLTALAPLALEAPTARARLEIERD